MGRIKRSKQAGGNKKTKKEQLFCSQFQHHSRRVKKSYEILIYLYFHAWIAVINSGISQKLETSSHHSLTPCQRI